MELILATHNKDKCKELEAALEGKGIKILTLLDFPNIGDIEENGTTLEENAFIKSRTVFNITKIPTISDDTGLEVDALGGEPGIFSARYAGNSATYDDNVNKLLENMKNIHHYDREAYFKTVVTFVSKDLELVARGSVKGTITKNKKGNKGFGYDPIFYIPELKKTFSEMSIKEKQRISHRGEAIKRLVELLLFHKLIS